MPKPQPPRPAQRRPGTAPTEPSDDSYLTLFPQDISSAVAYLLRLADPGTPTYFSVIGRSTPNLKYSEGTDWPVAAESLANAYGYTLRKVANTWFLAPAVLTVNIEHSTDGTSWTTLWTRPD